MGDHLALLVNRLLTESTLHAAIENRNRAKQANEGEEVAFMAPKVDASSQLVECRICQDEDWDSNMETPCFCSGSLKPFQPGYQAPPPLLGYGRIPVNFRRSWQISRRELADAQFTETISSDETLLNSSFVEPSSRSLIFRFIVAVIFIVLLILRHTLPIMIGGGSEFIIPLFLLAALRIAGILLLVYVTMIAVTGLRRHRYQEENSIASTSSDEEAEQQNVRQHSHVIQISS
ncbi:hypothetical protein Cgig2_000395 [Carnegiea gigantea]|uniref:RING-CH-type domain-containing protein n=1 Tax=Carnegiea gigantea TaxID=171969 RepID=A0A9Q1K7M0_9CARY|nr:hypothetical protein Cgig2_000395 [Carnegiea gigantea]